MESIKLFILGTHNILRWVIVILAIYTLFRLVSGWIRKKQWEQQDQRALTFLTISVDLQLLLGLLLYFVFSDLTKAAFADLAAAMGNQVLRFFTVEHSLFMVVGIILIHVANAIAKKDMPNQKKWPRVTLLVAFAFLLILAGVPWTTRPLLPAF